jgi:hypothetical protein
MSDVYDTVKCSLQEISDKSMYKALLVTQTLPFNTFIWNAASQN